MANKVFNISSGHVNEYVNRVINNDPTNAGLYVILLKTVETDSILMDYDTLDAILTAGAGLVNVECDFQNYVRLEITDALNVPSITVDDTNNRKEADFPDLQIVSAGGAPNNNIVKALVCYVPDIVTPSADSLIIPMTLHDFVTTTNGNNLDIQVDPNGFYRAASL